MLKGLRLITVLALFYRSVCFLILLRKKTKQAFNLRNDLTDVLLGKIHIGQIGSMKCHSIYAKLPKNNKACKGANNDIFIAAECNGVKRMLENTKKRRAKNFVL